MEINETKKNMIRAGNNLALGLLTVHHVAAELELQVKTIDGLIGRFILPEEEK